MNPPGVFKRLLDGEPVSLADWFADPPGTGPARQLAAGIRQRLLAGHDSPPDRFPLRLAEIIARFWAGHDVEAGVANFSALLREPRERALLSLCYGQLLLARRQQPAWEYLDRGFELATHLLEPEDYFQVLRRHELLRHLPLRATPTTGSSLAELLDEARVIARLQGPVRRRPGGRDGSHRDTVD